MLRNSDVRDEFTLLILKSWLGQVAHRRLVDVYEDLLLPKGKITRTNWEAELSPEQQEYAGNDAHSGYIVYEKLIAMSKLMATSPKAVYYTFDAVRGRLCESSGMHWSAFNPDYDPGPPPPPKIPKPPRAQDVVPVGTPITSLATSTSSLPQIASNPSNNASKRRNFSLQTEPDRNPRQNGSPSGYPNSRPRFSPPPSRGSSGSNFVSSSVTDAPQTTHLSDPTKLTLTGLEQSTKYSPRPRKRRRVPNPKPAPKRGPVD